MNKLYIGDVEISLKRSIFPGGEVYIKIDQYEDNRFRHFRIESKIKSSSDVMELLMLTDAVRREFGYDITLDLVLPYVPYARQDRVCNYGESLSVKVFCDLINAQNYSSIEVWDCHSDVTLALLNNVVHIQQHVFAENVIYNIPNVSLVCPDQGAYKKILKLSSMTNTPLGIVGQKSRAADGNVSLTVSSSIKGDENLLVVDDICDGGATFIELAKQIKDLTTGDLYLYTTHGIYSKGLQPLLKYYKHLYTANPFADCVNEDYVTVIKQRINK